MADSSWLQLPILDDSGWFWLTLHPVYFQKISAAPFGNMSPQLRGALVCSWADLQNLQGGAAPPHRTETRWTEKESFLCLSAPPVQAPHFGRLLCWMGVARYSRNYSGCLADVFPIFVDSDWLWLTLADSGRLWPTLTDSVWLWPTQTQTQTETQTLADSFLFWLTLDYSFLLWLTLIDSGRFWVTLAYSDCL